MNKWFINDTKLSKTVMNELKIGIVRCGIVFNEFLFLNATVNKEYYLITLLV